MAFIDENTQFYKQLYNHSKKMYTTAIVAFFATGPGWFLKFFELNFSLHIYFKVFHSLQNIHFLSFLFIPASSGRDSEPCSCLAPKNKNVSAHVDDTSAGLYTFTTFRGIVAARVCKKDFSQIAT